MSRVSNRKLEKTKVKVVFRLQFHATHVPQTGWDKLFISFIPADSGKATAKTTKANVRNGTCKWADPIYETTRLLQDSKTKQYNEKLYKIVVAMGSSRSGTLGEATINLAEYIDGLKPSAVTLPLHGCNFGTVLHMTVQLLTSKTGFREFEQQRELRENGIQSEPDRHGPAKLPFSEDAAIDRVDKGSSRIKYTTDANELPPPEEESNLNEEYADSATSESFQADKHETSSPHEIDSLRRTTSGDLSMLSHSQSPHAVKEEDPSIGNNELAMAFEENSLLKGSLELAESSLFNLKLEVSSLQTLANELGSETQRLSRKLASEISTSEELMNEISVMKLECLKFKDDIIKLQDLKPDPQIPTLEKNQVDHLVGAVESKVREVLSKSYLVPHDIDAKFIHSEFEALLDFLQDFKLRNDGIDVSGNELGLDLCQPENILQNLSMVPPMSEAANQKILDLVRELDDARIEKEALNRKANQMECYYEALIHELEEDQKRLLMELQHSREEHSTCLYTLALSKSETESLCHDMNQKMHKFVEERRELEALNKELEIRATTSEAALRRARLNYSIAVDKLQKDLQVLSSQVVSMFETNENLIKQALPESQKQRSVGEDILLVDLRRSLSMQEENYQKVKKEVTEMCSVNLNLDIYSRIMQESLREGDAQIKIMKGRMDELLKELELSSDSQNRLMIRLEKATNDIHALSEYKSSTISQCSDMAFENQLLEDKLANACEENYVLAQKVKDLESKYGACLAQLKQEGSENEKVKSEMSLLKSRLTKLKVESEELVLSKESLEESIDFVRDKLVQLFAYYDKEYIHLDNLGGVDIKSAILQLEEILHVKYCELLDENQNLKSERAIADESINFVRDKLVKMLASYNKEIFQVDLKDAILQLEEFQHDEHAKYCELLDENQNLKDERAVADVSLGALRSEIQTMKQKLRCSFEGMVTKLYVSSALVDKLQVEIESVANKLHLSSETEEKYSQFNKVLLGDLAVLEDQMQELSCKNGHLARDVSGLDALAEELERNGLTISKLMHDKQELTLCLQEKTEESMKLSTEISCLEETRKILQDERTYKDELEGKIRDLTLCLNEEQDKLLDLERQKAELMHVLDQQNVLIEELKRDNSHNTDLESQLLEMHSHSLVSDVKLIYVANHYEAVTEELVQKLMSSDVFVRELKEGYQGTEANWREEKANLLSSLESLRSDFEASEAQNKLLSDSNNEIKDEVEEWERKLTMTENNFALEISISKEELEISVLVLRNKIQELSDKLSKQVLKTEKYKNLSTHFEELKDKAEAECLVARGKREAEAIAKDSLRIAFIKDQCETQVQELKHQVSVSKKHGEELLLKLQDAIDEIENRKKSEAVNSKKKEELLHRISALEAEKREKTSIYDRTKAELECALLSLECCKEEKEKLGKSLMEFEEEKSRLAVELSLVKGQLEGLKFSTSFRMNELGSLDKVESTISNGDGENITQDVAGSELFDMEELLQSEDNNLDVDNADSGAQRLRSSMEHLHEELEKMKNENKVFDTISHDADPGFQDLQREIMKLHEANEELGSMFPPFIEFSGSGNALERVLALEIELAEALKAKNNPNTIFQSSFLKQHSDAEAVFKSFKDINELIREMLEVKERHSSMEAELAEMHDRYSQLSLRFAEVEGEREKLKMTLKNVRPSRNLVTLNRSHEKDAG